MYEDSQKLISDEKVKILVVDDEKTNVDLLVELLKDEYKVVVAKNGEQALQRAQATPQPDLILLDIMMPGMDGYEVCRHLKQNPQTQDIPLIFVTARSDVQDEFMGLQLGAADYITKPVVPSVVKARVRTHLAMRRLTLELAHKNSRLHEINSHLSDSLMKLSASEERFRSLMNTIPDIVYKIDTDGNFVFLNPSIEQLGYHPSDLIGKHFSTIIHSADVKNASLLEVMKEYKIHPSSAQAKVFDERRSGKRMTVGMEIRLKTKTGKNDAIYELNNINSLEVPVEVNSTGLYADVGDSTSYRHRQYVGTVGVIRNITERKNAEALMIEASKKIAEASRAKGEFLANMSHEIRTPMNAIIGLTHLCQQTNLTGQQKDYLNKISISAHALLVLINDILDFSKIDAGKLTMENISFQLDEVFHRVATTLSVKIREKSLELIFDTKENVPVHLEGDPYRLGQILCNLGTNAIKFTATGHVVIRTEIKEENNQSVLLQFSVRDTGIGMTPDQVDGLFQPFMQADASITRKYGGTGLGLVISKRLVEMMDGSIRVESEAGKGSTFSFSARFKKVFSAVSPSRLPVCDWQGMSVLVIDDNKSLHEILSGLLKALSVQTVCVESVAQAQNALAVAEAAGRPFRLVMLDWKLPEMNALEIARRIKKQWNVQHVPSVIMMTTHVFGMEEIMAQDDYDKALLDGFLMKPIYMSSLVDVLMTVFGSSQIQTRHDTREVLHINALVGARVLLAEDNEINQQVAIELLQQVQVKVTLANNGQEAVDWVAKESFDAVLMDLQMPVMDGLTATRQIRLLKSAEALPVIAMTANAMVGDRDICLQAGMNDHVAKPVVPDDLYATLIKWIGKDSLLETPMPPVVMQKQKLNEKTSLLSLPDVDEGRGVRNVGGNRELYRNLLVKFAKNQQGVAQVMDRCMAAGDAVTLERTAHTLKGVSATIGALKLADLAATVERFSRIAEEWHHLPDLLGRIDCALMQIQSAIAQALVQTDVIPAENDTDQVDATPEALAPLFHKAVAYLKAFDATVESVVEDLAILSRSRPRRERLNAIRKALEVYDYDLCQQEFVAWAKDEGIVLGSN
ncbi:MAG: response regulator [Magnetococcus sp. YQC-5]